MLRRSVLVLSLMIVLVATGCANRQPSPMQPFISPAPEENTVKITLYFSDESAVDVIPERREVLRRNEPLEAIVLRELIRGPIEAGMQRTIPAETRVISVEVVDRIAYANFSREIVSRHPGGSTGEYMTIMSIVYSLTELPGIEKVQLLLEGEKKEAMFGHGTTIDPIGRPSPQLFIANNLTNFELNGAPWIEQSPPLAGDITALGFGNITGKGEDIIAYAGRELYIFSRVGEGYQLSWSAPIDRHIMSIAVADITGDGTNELILAGAVSGNYNPNVPGFIAVYSWQDESLEKLTDLSRDTMPFWSAASLDITGDGRSEVLVSNGNALFIFEWKGSGLEQIHAVTRFSGTVSSGKVNGVDRMAWRDANGTSIGVFYWNKKEWVTVFRIDGYGEWTDSVPAYGDLTGDGRNELAILDLSGLLHVYSEQGTALNVSEYWQNIFVKEAQVSRPLIANLSGKGYLLYGRGSSIVLEPWK